VRPPKSLVTVLATLAGCAAVGTNAAPSLTSRLDTGPGIILATGTPAPAQPAAASPAVWGFLVNASGQPLAGASVKAFDALVGNNAGSLTAPARRIAANEGLTAADGSFLLVLPATGTYNLEGDKGGTLKVFVRGIAVPTKDIKKVGSQVMTPPGILSGTVRDSKGTQDLTGAQVFIPGSPYSAFVTAGGTYTLGAVAAGNYDLRAIHPTLGDARSMAAVTVTSGKTTQAPELVLATDEVRVDRLRDLDSGATTSIAAPGATLVMEGVGFGATRGRAFTLEIGGTLVTAATRSSDTRIEARVPASAQSGDLVLRVDATNAKAVPLRVIKTLGWRRTTWRMGFGDTLDPWELADVRDTAGQWIDLAASGPGPIILTASPATRITRSGTDDAPRIAALATGAATMGLKAGSLAAANVAVTVGAAGTGDQTALLQPRPGTTPAPSNLVRDGEVTVKTESGEVLIRNPLNQWAIFDLTEAAGAIATPPPDTQRFYEAWPTAALVVRSGANLHVLGGRKGFLLPPKQDLALRVNAIPGASGSLPSRTVRWTLAQAFSLDDIDVATSSERVVTLAASSSSGINVPLPDRFVRKVVRIRAAGDWGLHGNDFKGPDGQGNPGICTTPCYGTVPESALVRVESGQRLDDDWSTNPTSFVGSEAVVLVESGEALTLRMQDGLFGDNRGALSIWWDVLWVEP
jgi:hypothetical protein